MAITEKHLHILQHSIGADQYGKRRSDRNHFVAGEGNKDHLLCMELTQAGLMAHRPKFHLAGGSDLFHVTDAGIKHVAENSLPPPKLSRSQKRYFEFLENDSGLRFGEWLKMKGPQ